MTLACLLACASAYAAVDTIMKPALCCPAGVWFAEFNIWQGCTSDCPWAWIRVSKKNANGEWEVHYTSHGTSEERNRETSVGLEPGEYKLEVACHETGDDNWPPTTGWELCAYLVSWQVSITARGKAAAGTWGDANVAAGGKDSDVHKAEVRVTANPPLAGIPIDVSIADGQGEGSTRTA